MDQTSCAISSKSSKAKYPINPRRVYLFGHSAGASFALHMSLMESQYFAAVAIHAGALRGTTWKLIDLAKRKIPISIQVGDSDDGRHPSSASASSASRKSRRRST
jgi:poly(3-hydroxybutyrate) depolymerase